MSRKRRFVRSRRARQDLIEIWKHIAADNITAADALLDRIDESCFKLAENPELGSARYDIRPGLRHFIVGKYLILYLINDDVIDIVRIVHGRRNLSGLP